MVSELALADVGLEHRGLGLLGLQEERVLAVAAHHQQHPGARSDAADPDHLAGHLDEPVAVEEVAAVALEALAVTAEHLEDPLLELLGLIRGDELPRGDEQRRVADDPRLAVDHPDEAIERLHAVLLSGLATFFCAAFICLRSATLARSASSVSTSRRAYQTSRLRIAANSRIASR